MSQKFEREDFKAATAEAERAAKGSGAENGRQNHLIPVKDRRVRRSSSNH